jgi:TRAP-type C4-dicarboxylate transport system substrate-binding protein
MDDDHELSDDTATIETAFTAECVGPYGSVVWQVSKEMYALLPREDRDEVVQIACDAAIDPFFGKLMERLLKQAGRIGIDASAFDTSWSLHDTEAPCSYGLVIWSISQGFWDALPEDQRDTLLEVSRAMIHQFFHEKVQQTLAQYAFEALTDGF